MLHSEWNAFKRLLSRDMKQQTVAEHKQIAKYKQQTIAEYKQSVHRDIHDP